MSPGPPRLANWLLRQALPPDRYETISGDLEEAFRLEQQPRSGPRGARRWFWRQTLSVVSAQLLRPDRTCFSWSSLRKGTPMQAFRQDLRYATRTLLKTPGFTFIALLTLALGIGGTTAIFTLVNALLLKPLPFSEPERLMLVHLLLPDREGTPGVFRETVWSYPKYQVFRANQHSFEDTALFTPYDRNLTGAGDPERIHGEVIGTQYLSVLGVTPQLGRDFQPEEDRTPGGPAIVMLGHALWERRFGADPTVIGRTIGLDSIPHTIVGVLPAGFRGLTGEAQFWVPVLSVGNPDAVDIPHAQSHSYYCVARRKAEVSETQAQSEVRVLGSRVDAAYPDTFRKQTAGASAVSFDSSRVDPMIRRAVLVLLSAIAAVLLIGCVNLANLMLARSFGRQREMAIRMAIGATRMQVIRQFLTESLLLSMSGGVAGIGVAYGAMKLAGLLMPEAGLVLPRTAFGLTRVGIGMIDLDSRTMLFALGTAGLTTLMFGLMPAWQASQSDVTHAIKAGGAGSIGRGSSGGRNLLIVAEVALALVLLMAAGLMSQSVANLQATGLGFRPDGLITFGLALPDGQYNRDRAFRFYTALLERLHAEAGVQAAAYGSCAPVSGGCNRTALVQLNAPPVSLGSAPLVGILWASPEYFQTLGVRLVKGRTFTDRDRIGQPKVVLVNETAARTLWHGDDPIGTRIGVGQGGFGESTGGAEVVGIVADVRYRAVESPAEADVYLPLPQSPRASGLIFVRSTLDSSALVAEIRKEVEVLDPNLPVADIKTMGRRFGDATWRTRLSADLLDVFGALALLLAAIGLYGVMSQAVEERTREIGVRMALGADRGAILRLVIGRALAIAIVGIAAGVGLSLLSMRFMDALLYKVRPNDPVTLATLTGMLVVVTLLASYVPARRATRVDPLESLRAE